MENRADFTVDSQVLAKTLEAMNKLKPQYDESLSEIKTATEDLIDTANWKGKGRDEFKDAYRILEHYLTDDADKISSMSEMLKGFKDIYDAADVESAKKLYDAVTGD